MFRSKMIRKLILIFAFARGLMCLSTGNDFPFTQSSVVRNRANETANSILNAISPMFTPLWAYATEAISSYETYLASLIFRTEFFFAAIGEHVLPTKAIETTPEDDARHHITAMTTVELMNKLRSMDRVSAVVNNVTHEVATRFLHKQKRTGRPEHIHAHEMFENVERELENDTEYQNAKKKFAQQYVRPVDVNHFHSQNRWNENFFSKIQSIIQDTQFSLLKLNIAFLRKSKTRFDAVLWPNEYEKFTLANALMRLAKDQSYDGKVQKLYNSAVYSVLKNINPWYRTVEATDALFAALRQGVQNDVELKKAVDLTSKTVPINVKDIGKYELDFLL